MVASLVTSWRSLRRRSLTSRQSTIAPTRSVPLSNGRTRTIKCASPDTSSVRRAFRPDSTDGIESSTGPLLDHGDHPTAELDRNRVTVDRHAGCQLALTGLGDLTGGERPRY